jgi:hypothetical protein
MMTPLLGPLSGPLLAPLRPSFEKWVGGPSGPMLAGGKSSSEETCCECIPLVASSAEQPAPINGQHNAVAQRTPYDQLT